MPLLQEDKTGSKKKNLHHEQIGRRDDNISKTNVR